MEKLCRSCMCESTNGRNLFEIKDPLDQPHLIADMLMACASVEITKGDLLPKVICAQCELKLSIAFDFKRQSEKADVSLRQLVQGIDEGIETKPEVNDYYNDDDNDTISEGIEIKPEVSDSYYDGDNGTMSSADESNARGNEKNLLNCQFCSKGFRAKSDYKLHMRKHNNEKLHTCHLCQEKFSKSNLLKHLRTVHKTDIASNSYACDECDLTFPKAYLLSGHIKNHNKQITNDVAADNVNISMSDNLSNEENRSKSDMDKYECKFCSKVLATHVGLKLHMRRHIDNNLHMCHVCKKTFTKNNYLKCHMLTHGIEVEAKKSCGNNKKDKIMQCEFCDQKFKYEKNFNQHIHNEHGISDDSDAPLSTLLKDEVERKEKITESQKTDETNDADVTDNDANQNINTTPDSEFLMITKVTKFYTCHVCNTQFVRSNHLTRHMTLHKAILIYKCHRCETAFSTPEYLAKHVQEDHIDKPHTCMICDKTYAKGEQLIRHLKVHLKPTELDIKCSICEKQFTRSDQLVKHLRLHLQQDKSHRCNECGKIFKRLDHLQAHQRIHNGQKTNTKLHLCIYCGKEFKNSSNMIVHMRRHTGERPYKCSHCGKGFPRSHDLKCHERTHSGEKPYVCVSCGKAFNKSNKLLRHTRVHTGERPYVCNICGKGFTQSNDLVLHTRRHTGATPYACGVCPARFIQSGQLKAHKISTGHSIETQPDLKGGHRVEPVVTHSTPVPIISKTHAEIQQTKVSQPCHNSVDTTEQATVMEDAGAITTSNAVKENVDESNEVHYNYTNIVM
ncbi:hypothetical protein Trydic_g10940 [Trypoxylus dichotomus]